MALGSKQANAALADWVRNYKYNTKVSQGKQAAAGGELQSYMVEIRQVKNLKMPPEI